MNNPSIRRFIAILKLIPLLAQSWKVRESELMRGNAGTVYPKESLLQQKPRYNGDWFRLETKWMGGEMD